MIMILAGALQNKYKLNSQAAAARMQQCCVCGGLFMITGIKMGSSVDGQPMTFNTETLYARGKCTETQSEHVARYYYLMLR